MDKHEDTSTWLKFFKDAGIPTKTGASYALIFVENRIHKDMLSEMTVDYLRLMGITLMGDIIAILRHCKNVHQDSLRKVVILQSKDVPKKAISTDSESDSASSSSGSSSSEESDVEMVEVTKPSSKKPMLSLKTLASKVKKELPPQAEIKQIRSKVIGKVITPKPAPSAEKKPSLSVKRKYDVIEPINKEQPSVAKTALSGNGKSILRIPEPAVKKICVTTENDVMGPKLPPSKKTVFDRLGAETGSPQVSSTTELPKSESVQPTFTRTINHVNLPIKTVKITGLEDSTTKLSSVFARLGGHEAGMSEKRAPGLPYAGVLKSIPPTEKKSLLMKKIGTMRADEPEVPVKLRASTKPVVKTNNIRLRVGRTTRPSPMNALKNSIRLRLGRTQMEVKAPTRLAATQLSQGKGRLINKQSEGIFANHVNVTSISSVKNRLGSSSNSGEVSSTTQRSKLRMDETDSLGHKKVRFGRVEQRLITPASKPRPIQRQNGRLSVHSWLGGGGGRLL